jgi:hypothetical protein
VVFQKTSVIIYTTAVTQSWSYFQGFIQPTSLPPLPIHTHYTVCFWHRTHSMLNSYNSLVVHVANSSDTATLRLLSVLLLLSSERVWCLPSVQLYSGVWNIQYNYYSSVYYHFRPAQIKCVFYIHISCTYWDWSFVSTHSYQSGCPCSCRVLFLGCSAAICVYRISDGNCLSSIRVWATHLLLHTIRGIFSVNSYMLIFWQCNW